MMMLSQIMPHSRCLPMITRLGPFSLSRTPTMMLNTHTHHLRHFHSQSPVNSPATNPTTTTITKTAPTAQTPTATTPIAKTPKKLSKKAQAALALANEQQQATQATQTQQKTPEPIPITAQDLQELRYVLFEKFHTKSWSKLQPFVRELLLQYRYTPQVHDTLSYFIKRLLERHVVRKNIVPFCQTLIETGMTGLDMMDIDLVALDQLLNVGLTRYESFDVINLMETYVKSAMERLDNGSGGEKHKQGQGGAVELMFSLLVTQVKLKQFSHAQTVYFSMVKMHMVWSKQQLIVFCSTIMPLLPSSSSSSASSVSLSSSKSSSSSTSSLSALPSSTSNRQQLSYELLHMVLRNVESSAESYGEEMRRMATELRTKLEMHCTVKGNGRGRRAPVVSGKSNVNSSSGNQ